MRKKNILAISVVLFALLFYAGSVIAATVTIRPNAQGVYSAWGNVGCSSSSEWQCVDENPANTSDYVNTTIASTFESFNFSDTGLASNETINNLTLYYYAQRVSSTRYRTNPLIRIGGTNYIGTLMSFTASWAYYPRVYTKNPATGTWWTTADVDALEAGMRSYTSTPGGRVAQVYADVKYGEALADLIISNLTFVEWEGQVNGTGNISVNVTTTVMNNGPGGAVSSTARITPLEDIDWGIPALASGNTYTFTWSYSCSSAHTFTATADYYDAVLETDETNNAASTYIDCIM